jgi:hypothetical protein
MHVCMYVWMNVCMYVCTYVRMYVFMYVCMYVCLYVQLFDQFHQVFISSLKVCNESLSLIMIEETIISLLKFAWSLIFNRTNNFELMHKNAVYNSCWHIFYTFRSNENNKKIIKFVS